jgi:hypothetical protein
MQENTSALLDKGPKGQLLSCHSLSPFLKTKVEALNAASSGAGGTEPAPVYVLSFKGPAV